MLTNVFNATGYQVDISGHRQSRRICAGMRLLDRQADYPRSSFLVSWMRGGCDR